MSAINWRTLTFIGLLSTLTFNLQAQEAPELRPPDRAAIEPQAPSRANNWHLPKSIRYNGEEVTEGFWTVVLCGKPVMLVYDAEGQMALPLFGQPMIEIAREHPWALDDGPPLLILPDLAEMYAPVRGICDDLARLEKEIRDRKKHEGEIIAPPKTRMK